MRWMSAPAALGEHVVLVGPVRGREPICTCDYLWDSRAEVNSRVIWRTELDLAEEVLSKFEPGMAVRGGDTGLSARGGAAGSGRDAAVKRVADAARLDTEERLRFSRIGQEITTGDHPTGCHPHISRAGGLDLLQHLERHVERLCRGETVNAGNAVGQCALDTVQ